MTTTMKRSFMKSKEVKDASLNKDFKPSGVLPSLTSRQKTVTIQAVPSVRLPNYLPAPGCPDDQDGSLTKSCFLSESELDDMPEMFSLSTSSVVSYPALQITGTEWGGSPSSLLQADLVRNQKLKQQLAQLRLSDFFDVHGGPHFKSLSITFAAKQNPEVASSFGSTGDLHAAVDVATLMDDLEDRKGMLGSSKAFLAASEARARDMLLTREKAQELLRKVNDQERVRTADVNQRRLARLFVEIPAFEALVPSEIELRDLMPADNLEEEETAAKQLTERQNAFLSDQKYIEGSQMSWLFSQTEVLLISKAAQRWSSSTRGANAAVIAAGMDRPTFCRMLFDLDLVGEPVPYFWAVCLFDSMAEPMRLCADADHVATAPVVHVVNRFRLISVLDMIVRQRFEPTNREAFLEVLKQNAKKLKAFSDPLTSGEQTRDSVENANVGKQAVGGKKSQAQPKGKAEKEAATPLSCRDRLISAMLIEPEVLHLVFCFQQKFQTLFNCYAPQGNMQFTDLWQFCVDFQLAPRFITEQQLRRAYEATECFSISPPRVVREPLGRGPSKARKRNRLPTDSSKTRSKAASRSSSPGSQNQHLPLPDPRQEKEKRERHNSSDSTVSSASEQQELQECDTVFGVNAFIEALCRVAFLYLSFYGSTLQQSTSSYFKITWLLTYLRRMSGLILDHLHQNEVLPCGAAALVSQLPGLWDDCYEDVPDGSHATLVQPPPGPGHEKPVRRRSKQQGMAPRLRPSKPTRDAALALKKQKTLNNIRQAAKNLGKAALVVKKMTENQEFKGVVPRRLDDSSSDEDIPQPSLSKVALSNNETKDRIAALTTKMAASLQKPTKKQRKMDTNLMPVEDLFKVEGGKPAVVDGTCQLCGRSTGGSHTGNPACRGCAIVDSMNLQAHPLARLLYPDSNPYGNAKILRPKAKQHSGERLRPAFQLPEQELPRIDSQALLD